MPNLACMILAMDHMGETFSTDSLNESKDPAICATLSITRKMLNRYYGLTNSSEVNQIAVGELGYSPLRHFLGSILLHVIVLL